MSPEKETPQPPWEVVTDNRPCTLEVRSISPCAIQSVENRTSKVKRGVNGKDPQLCPRTGQ